MGIYQIGFTQTNILCLPSSKKILLLDTVRSRHLAFSLDTFGEGIIISDTMSFKFTNRIDFYNSNVFYHNNNWDVIEHELNSAIYFEIESKFKVLADGNLKGFVSVPIIKMDSLNKYSKTYVEGLCVFLLINNNFLIDVLNKKKLKNTLLRPMANDVYIPMVIYVSSTDYKFHRTNWEGYHKIKDKLLPAR